MLRNRSRAVKQALVSDHRSQSSTTTTTAPPTQSHSSNNKPKPIIPSLLGSEFRHCMLNPPSNSIKPGPPTMTSLVVVSQFWRQNHAYALLHPTSTKSIPEKKSRLFELTPPGLALVNVLLNDAGDKTHEGGVSPIAVERSGHRRGSFGQSRSKRCDGGGDRIPMRGGLSVSEMEVSEDYTCVISHGPNPAATHIFGNLIIEKFSLSDDDMNSNYNYYPSSKQHGPESFLSTCYTCKKRIEQTADIYIYRGEKAFCSSECRYREILRDEAAEVGEGGICC